MGATRPGLRCQRHPGEDPTLIWIDISYVRLADLRPDNLVYPFYLR